MRLRRSRIVSLLLAMIIIAAGMAPISTTMTANAETLEFAATGTVYYVNAIDGNDMNAGTTPETAWQTLYKVNDTEFQPGDAILFQAGGAWSGMLHPKGSGSDGFPIQIDQYGEGPKPLIAGNGVDAAIYFYNQEYWEVRNLEITNNAADPGQRRGIHVSGNSGDDWSNLREYKHYVFENLDIHSVKGEQGGGWFSGGIIVWSPTYNYAVSDVIVKNNKIYSLDSVGVYLNGASRLFSSGNRIQNNMIYDISADGAVLLNTTNGLIENNVVFDTHKRAGGYHVPLWTWGTEDAVIQYNEVFNTYPGGDAMAYDSDFRSMGTKIQYNYSHNNAGGFVLAINDGTNSTNINRDTIIRYNISQNDQHTIFTLAGPIENTLVHNNTIYIPEHSDARVVASGSWGGYAKDTYFYNNILVNHGSGGYTFGQSTNNVFDSNLFYGNHPVDVLAMDANKVTADPMLASPGSATIGRDTVIGYQLLQGSPAIGAGAIIPNNGSLDFWGNPVPTDTPPNIGAYEGAGLDPNNLPPLPSPPEEVNLLMNQGFEAGEFTAWGYHYNGAAIVDNPVHTGDYAAQMTNAVSGIEQIVTGLKPNTMYRLSGYGTGANGGSAVLGAKNYGVGYKDVRMNSTDYAWSELTFTTGSTDTSATIYLYKSSGTGEVYVDDLLLIEYGQVPGSASSELPPDPVFTVGVSDEFNATTLDPQWNWIREKSQNWSLSANLGHIRIISEAGDIVNGQTTARNILLTGAPEGDWTIETRMDGKPTSQWSQGGLIVYESDQTYFRLTRLFGSGNQLQFTKQIDGIREHVEVPDTIESTVSYLRIVKQGNTFGGYYSADGVEYTQVWTTQIADLTDLKIGLIVCAGTGLVADFDYFHITEGGTNPPPSEPIPVSVTGVSLNPTALSLHMGESATLTASVMPSNATNKVVTWSSDNQTVVQVNGNGVVTTLGIGAATITVTTVDGAKTAISSVQVLPPADPVAGNIAPIAELTVSSSHENENFPPNKAVNGIKNQDASRWITNTTLAGSHWFQMDWDQYYEIENVKIWSGFKGLTGRQIADFQIQYWDGNGWNTAVTVTNNPQDGRIDQFNDLVFPAVTTNKLRMHITKGSAYDQIARLFEIEVWGLETEVTHAPVSSISVTSENGASSILLNETLQMIAVVEPENATDKSVAWSIVGESGGATDKASIDQNGLLTAHMEGIVKAVATANDGSGVNGESVVTIISQPEPVVQNIAPLAELTVDSTNGAFTKDKAVNGINNQNASRWISDPNAPGPHWFQMEWDNHYVINNVKLWSGFRSWMGSQLADFEIQYWDGSDWQTVASITGNTMDNYYGDYNDLDFPAVTTNKLRLYITKGSINDNTARLFEIEVWTQEQEAIDPINIDTEPPVIETPEQLSFLQTESIVMTFAATDHVSGLQSLAVSFNGQSAVNPITSEAFSLSVGEYPILVTAIDNAGHQSQMEFTLRVIMDIDHLDELINYGADQGWISNAGIANSMMAHVKNIQRDKGNVKKVHNSIKAMENALKAQKGKHINELFASIVLEDLEWFKARVAS